MSAQWVREKRLEGLRQAVEHLVTHEPDEISRRRGNHSWPTGRDWNGTVLCVLPSDELGNFEIKRLVDSGSGLRVGTPADPRWVARWSHPGKGTVCELLPLTVKDASYKWAVVRAVSQGPWSLGK